MSDSDANGASSIPSHELELGGNSGERERAADGYRQRVSHVKFPWNWRCFKACTSICKQVLEQLSKKVFQNAS